MSLTSGTRVGSYEVLSPLGAGGMGEVFRAKDTKLGREVALKVLPEALASDPERLARFQREAQVLASLNHPNIAALYGVEDAGDIRALVMELVEGPTLAERIAQGRMPTDEVLSIATQIADALAAAHERSVIHRDLKPANIKLRPDGTVKVLDFGLAKGLQPASGSSFDAAASPTVTSPAMMTTVGVLLGTAAYMSPEQARGKQADSRADIWAFGVVLAEMLTGKRLFDGEDLTDTISSVVKQHPDLREVPREFRKVVEACLKKNPRERLQVIADWKLLVAEADSERMIPARSGSGRVWLAASAVLALLLTALAFVHFREAPPEERVVRLSVPLPANAQAGFLELSPDGQRLLLAMIGDGRTQLHLRSLDAPELTPLAGTVNARTPFWSPDGRFIAFFADGTLKVISAAGGPAQIRCRDTGLGSGGTWNRDGVLMFAADGRLRRVDTKGGECRPVVNADSGYRAAYPVFHPDGRHFFYLGVSEADPSSAGVYLAALDDFPGRRLLADVSSVVYAPAARGRSAHLLFLRESALMAQPFDEAKLELAGDPFVLAEQASGTLNFSQVAASAAGDGTLVYLAGGSRETQLAWFDRTGKKLSNVGPRTVDQAGVSLSPDGTMVAIGRRDTDGTGGGLWLHDLLRGSESRLTPAGTPGGYRSAVWSPDSNSLRFGMAGPSGRGRYDRNIRNGALELLRETDAGAGPGSDWSRDGRFFVYTEIDPKTQADIWYMPLQPGKPAGKPIRVLGTSAVESQGQVSRDGKWLAYASNESGDLKVYIRPFPTGEGSYNVSVDGGREPRWGKDDKELFFQRPVGPDRIALFAVAVVPDARGGLRPGAPQPLFEIAARTIVAQQNTFVYSPHPDGRFLVNVLTDPGEQTVNVITNWQQTVAAK